MNCAEKARSRRFMKWFLWGNAGFWCAVWCLYYASGEGYSAWELWQTTLLTMVAGGGFAGLPFLVRASGRELRKLFVESLPCWVLPLIGLAVDYLNYNHEFAFFRYSLASLCGWMSWSLFWGMLDFRSRSRAVRALCRSVAYLPVTAALFFKFELTLRFLCRQLDSVETVLPLLVYLSGPLLKLLAGEAVLFLGFYWFDSGNRAGRMENRRPVWKKLLPLPILLFTGLVFMAGPAWDVMRSRLWDSELLLRYSERRRVLPPEQLTGAVSVRDAEPGVFFLIIGERQSAEPYRKLAESRPLFLSRLQASGEWIDFRQAFTRCPPEEERCYSGQIVTDYAVTMMLTPLTEAVTPKGLYEVSTLFDFARAGGYRSYFISSMLVWRSLLMNINLLADSADTEEWLTDSSPTRQLNMAMDRKIVSRLHELREAGELAGRKLVVAKLMGNHAGNITPPPELAEANPGLDEYELSLLYFDETFRQLVAEAEACPDLAAIVYLPDHGKEYRTEERIPLLIHLSDRFRKLHPELEQELRENASKPFMSADLFPLMLKLLGVVPRGE